MKRPGMMLREVLKSAVNRPVTVRYPFVKANIPKRFRGKLAFNPASCIGCKICERDCPSNAINIRKVGDKKFECDVDLARCIYCGQCVDSCPKKSLGTTENFELAQLHRESLKCNYHGQEGSMPAVVEAPKSAPAPAAPKAAPAPAAATASAAPPKPTDAPKT